MRSRFKQHTPWPALVLGQRSQRPIDTRESQRKLKLQHARDTDETFPRRLGATRFAIVLTFLSSSLWRALRQALEGDSLPYHRPTPPSELGGGSEVTVGLQG